MLLRPCRWLRGADIIAFNCELDSARAASKSKTYYFARFIGTKCTPELQKMLDHDSQALPFLFKTFMSNLQITPDITEDRFNALMAEAEACTDREDTIALYQMAGHVAKALLSRDREDAKDDERHD
jgi:hypothetical protein